MPTAPVILSPAYNWISITGGVWAEARGLVARVAHQRMASSPAGFPNFENDVFIMSLIFFEQRNLALS